MAGAGVLHGRQQHLGQGRCAGPGVFSYPREVEIPRHGHGAFLRRCADGRRCKLGSESSGCRTAVAGYQVFEFGFGWLPGSELLRVAAGFQIGGGVSTGDGGFQAVLVPEGAVFVVGEDRAVLFPAFPVDGAAGMGAVGGFADVDLRCAVKIEGGDGVVALEGILPLRFETAVIDAIGQAQLGHHGVVRVGPGFAPEGDVLPCIPIPILGRCEAGGRHGPVGEQHVGVPVARISAMFGRRPVNGHISDHASAHQVGGDEALEHGDLHVHADLMRQGDNHLAGKPCVRAVLDALHGVPQRLRVKQFLPRDLRRQDAGPGHADFAAVVEHLAIVAELLRALVCGGVRDRVRFRFLAVEPFPPAVGSGGEGALVFQLADGVDVEVIVAAGREGALHCKEALNQGVRGRLASTLRSNV